MDTTTAAGAATATQTAEVVVLGGPADPGVELLGGKGARLDEMIRAGLPVPAAFCLTTALFERFLAESGPVAPDRAEPRAVREGILAAELPESVARPVLAAYEELGRPRVAVRSSGRAEDSASQSFAGQHDTVLDVAGDEALLEAVKVCWASLWSDRAAAYRQGQPAGGIAVVVQKMVHADAGGVLFTVDPLGDHPHRMVVEGCWGLGEGLVAGKVTSDLWVLDDRSLEVVEERIRYKVTQCVPVGPGQVGLVKVDAAARNMPCLSPGLLRELAALALQLRSRYGTEQDVEWAVRDGELWLLQSRPITTRPVARVAGRSPYREAQPEPFRSGTLWSRMDIGEIFSGVMSPLGISFARYYQDHVHGDCATALGVRDTGDVDRQMGYLQGHVYLNISYTSHLLGQCPPTRDQRHFTARFASEEVDLDAYTNPFGRYPGGGQGLVSTAFWLRSTATEMRRMRGRAVDMTASRRYEFDRAQGMDLTALTRRELDAELRRHLAYFHDMHVGYMPYYINAFGFYGVLSELCAKWLGRAGANLQNRVKTDMSSLRTVESAREIRGLARAAVARPRVLAIIRDSPLQEVPGRLRADEDGRAFWAAHIAPFLRENGTRGRQEMELTHPRWIDDPSYVFQMIRRYAEEGLTADGPAGAGPGVPGGTAAGTAADPVADVLRTLPGAKQLVLRKVISQYTLCSELRETTRMAMITSIWLVRRVVYEVGRRLVEQGVLRSLDEVAYVDFADVLGYLGSTVDAADVFSRAALDEARRTAQFWDRLPEPPLTIVGEYDVTRALPPTAEGGRLEGLGASPGRVVGRARIIEDLVWQADELQAGEILVTRFTDASWTPLFAIAGGIVTDVGSMLSHSSIVSREFGVPSVVNTKIATQRIRTGDLITVDGDAGVVDVVSDHEQPAPPPAERDREAVR